MTDTRHQPYIMQDPPQSDDPADFRDYLGNEFRKIEQAQNGVDLDVETRWGNIYYSPNPYIVKLPPSYKEGSVIKPSLTILFPNSATASTTLVYTLNWRILTAGITAGGTTADPVTATAFPNMVKLIEFAAITATASIDSYVECSISVANQDYSSTAATILSMDVRFEMDALGSEQEYNKA